MAPKRKREPTTKATAPKPAKEAGGDISSTSAGQVVLPKGTKVSKRPILVPRRQKRKPAARRNATATKPDPPTKTQPTDVVPAVTTLPRHLKIQRIGSTAPAVSASHAPTRPRSPKPRGSSSLRTRRAPHRPPLPSLTHRQALDPARVEETRVSRMRRPLTAPQRRALRRPTDTSKVSHHSHFRLISRALSPRD